MRTILLCLFLLGLGSACDAAEIFAWRVPVMRIGEGGLETKGVVKMDRPSEPSVFFKEGDDLHDLSGVESFAPVGADWIVWNAASGRLVMKGDRNAARRMAGLLNVDHLEIRFRLVFDFFDSPGNSPEWSAGGVPKFSRSVTIGAGKTELSADDSGVIPFRLSASAVFGDMSLPDQPFQPFGYFAISMTTGTYDGGKLELDTAFELVEGRPVWLARDGGGKTGMDVRVSATGELWDGTPRTETLLLEKAGKAEPLVLGRGAILARKVGDGWFAAYSIDMQHDFRKDPGGADPFAILNAFDPLSDLPKIVPPESIKQWIDSPVVDASDVFRHHGSGAGPGEFMGYDPFQRLLFCRFKEQSSCVALAELLMLTCQLEPKRITVSLSGACNQRLVSISGRRASMKRSAADGKVVRSLEIEPTIGEDSAIMDMRLAFQYDENPSRKLSLKTALTLRAGVPVDISEGGADGKDYPPLRATAEIEVVSP